MSSDNPFVSGKINNGKKMREHHRRKKEEGLLSGDGSNFWINGSDHRVRYPRRQRAEALSLFAKADREYLAETNPNHGALRDGEAGDGCDQQPWKRTPVMTGGKDNSHAPNSAQETVTPR